MTEYTLYNDPEITAMLDALECMTSDDFQRFYAQGLAAVRAECIERGRRSRNLARRLAQGLRGSALAEAGLQDESEGG